jgi:hypothetical protein
MQERFWRRNVCGLGGIIIFISVFQIDLRERHMLVTAIGLVVYHQSFKEE